MKTLNRWLVVDSKGACRVVQRYPRLALDEVGVRLSIKMPEGWGRVLPGELVIQLPEPPAPTPDYQTVTAADQ